jgi:hypothetical protein
MSFAATTQAVLPECRMVSSNLADGDERGTRPPKLAITIVITIAEKLRRPASRDFKVRPFEALTGCQYLTLSPTRETAHRLGYFSGDKRCGRFHGVGGQMRVTLRCLRLCVAQHFLPMIGGPIPLRAATLAKPCRKA